MAENKVMELEAQAFRIVVEINNLQNKIAETNQRLQEKQQQIVAEKAKPVENVEKK